MGNSVGGFSNSENPDEQLLRKVGQQCKQISNRGGMSVNYLSEIKVCSNFPAFIICSM